MAQHPIQPPTLPPMAFPPWQQQYNTPSSSTPSHTSPPPSFEPPAKRVKLAQPPQANGQSQEKEQKESNNFDAFNDVALSAGVDLAREEELIRIDPRQSQSFKVPSTQSFSDRGILSQTTEDSMKEEVDRKHKAAARAEAERRQEHMLDPFLQGHSVRKRMEKIVAQKEFSADLRTGLRIPMDGLFDLQRADEQTVQGMYPQYRPAVQPLAVLPNATTNTRQPTQSHWRWQNLPWASSAHQQLQHDQKTDSGHCLVQRSQPGPNGERIMVAQQVKAPSKVAKDAPLSHIFALLSLGCHDHIRNLLEDAYGEARSRRFNSDGIVPPDWSDLAFKDSVAADSAMAAPSSTTGSSWEPTTSTERQRSKVFQRSKSPTTSALHSLARQDREMEKLRAQRRAERKQRKAKQAADAATATTENGAAAADSAMPPPEMPKPISKKELQKQQKADYSEEAATRSANATAAMQIGGRQYSWLGGSKGKGAAKAALPTSGAKTAVAPKTTTSQTTAPGEKAKEVKLGVWREDGPGGRGVQMRDWVNVLERDGNEKKALNLARLKLGHETLGFDKEEQTSTAETPKTGDAGKTAGEKTASS